ncbi:MAG TPA: anthranilate phosphoribosyltransferase [Candidatus Binataceae bacterium]|nr:anthranilate phosphoribosyltransferase [Candidatus Binataceae bacterium]
MSDFASAYEAVLNRRALSADEAARAFGAVLDGDVSEPLTAAFLIALKMKGETGDELAGCARAMRSRARALKLGVDDLLDTCGSGGDNAGTFNISTGAALIAAAAGVPVAKHGNRAISGKVGGADVLEKFGIKIDCDPPMLRKCLRATGCCFIFAPAYHPAMARLAPLRRTLATRTLFNLMGPLVNPALPTRQVSGVSEARLFAEFVRAVALLGTHHAMIVHGLDGLDEISISAETRVAEIRGESISEYTIVPEQFGIERAGRTKLRADDAEHSAKLLRAALVGDEDGPAEDILALNGGAAIYVGGKADSLAEGIAKAREVIESERALEVIDEMRRITHGAVASGKKSKTK